MAKPLPEDNIPFTPPRQNSKDLSLQEVCDIIDEVIEAYLDDKYAIYYGIMLQEKGLYNTRLQYWREKYPESILPRMTYLQELQKDKYLNALVSNKGKDLNATNLVWFGKTKLGMMEEATKQKLENEKKGLDIYEQEISIGFEEEDEE